MTYALYALAGMEAAGVLLSVALTGRPRKPLTPADAVIRVIVGGAVTTILVLAALGIH